MPDLSAPAATSDIVCFGAGGKISHQAGNCTVSSQRFKHDIEDWAEGLDLVLALNPVTYKRNSDNVEELGLIAEQVYEVDPHFIIFEPGSTSTPRSVDYERLVIPLISAIQSQQQQIDGLLLSGAGINSSTPQSTSEEELLYAANRPLTSALEYLITKVSEGAFVVKDFLAERITAVVGVFKRVKTDVIEVDNGIEMKDQTTGQIYCVVIVDGEIIKIPGKCEDSSEEGSSNINIQSDGSLSEEPVPPADDPQASSETIPPESPNLDTEDVEDAVSDILSDILLGSGTDTESTTSGTLQNGEQ